MISHTSSTSDFYHFSTLAGAQRALIRSITRSSVFRCQRSTPADITGCLHPPYCYCSDKGRHPWRCDQNWARTNIWELRDRLSVFGDWHPSPIELECASRDICTRGSLTVQKTRGLVRPFSLSCPISSITVRQLPPYVLLRCPPSSPAPSWPWKKGMNHKMISSD